MTSGYRGARLYRDDVSKPSFLCKKCGFLLKNPLQDTQSGFRYCKKCTESDRKLNSRIYFKDRAMEKEMEDLIVCCKYVDVGCEWARELKKWETHVYGCHYRPVDCSKCGREIPEMNASAHAAFCKNPIFPVGVATKTEESKIDSLERKLELASSERDFLRRKVEDLKVELAFVRSATFDGTYLWKIPEIHTRRREARDGTTVSIYSPPFYTSKTGYKMCLRAYLNGDGIGKGSHVSFFWVMMKGDYDDLLKWPFIGKVTIKLLDVSGGGREISDTFKTTVSSSFEKPTKDMNVATGFPRFVKKWVLDVDYSGLGTYIKDDSIYVKCIVELSDASNLWTC